MKSQVMNNTYFKNNDLVASLLDYELWLFFAWNDIKIRYRRSLIGPFWITLSMSIFCVMLGLVYSRLFKAEIIELFPFLSIGLVIWGFIASCIAEMPNLFVENATFMKDMRINPLTILLRVFARNCIIFAHNMLIVVGIYLYFGIWPGWNGLLAIPGFLVVALNLIAIGIPLSIVGARFRDLAQIIQNVLQAVFFITPIFWFPRLLPKGSWILTANPATYYIDLIRTPLLGQYPQPISWVVAIGTLATTSTIAIWIYRKKSAHVTFWV